MNAEQIPFDLGHREAHEREDFWVSGCNGAAVAWIDKWPAWEADALVLYGPAGCGKTHLGQVMSRKAGEKAVVIDDADTKVGNAKAEEDIFHLFSRAREGRLHILLTGSKAPREWGFALSDLRSRVLASPAVAVGAPDDQLRAVLLAKLFSDRQIFVGQDVVQFILSRAERSFAALGALVDDVDRAALAEKRAVTVPFIRDLMQKKLL